MIARRWISILAFLGLPSLAIADAGISLSGAYATAAGGEYLTVLQAADIDALVAALQ